MNELEEIAERHQEPYTLICLYIRTLEAEEREELSMKSDKYDRMRFNAKAMRGLVQQGFVTFDWETMEASITDKGLAHVKVLIKEIWNR